MSAAKMTLIGLQKYMTDFNDDLFKNMVLPEGIDKDVLTDNFLLRGGEFEVLYADPHFLQDAITLWSKKWYRTFEKWVAALSIEYNPLENYDRQEDYTDTLNKGVKTSARTDSGNTRTFANDDTTTPGTTMTTETQVSAFDSSTYQPSEKVIVTPSGVNGDVLAHTGTITDEFGEGSSGSETENSKTIHDGRIHGNIGVTTSQQMLQSELEIAEWNLYEHITDLFLSEFVIPIYT